MPYFEVVSHGGAKTISGGTSVAEADVSARERSERRSGTGKRPRAVKRGEVTVARGMVPGSQHRVRKAVLAMPQSLPAFHAMFPDERACVDYLIALRWPDRRICDNCKGTEYSFYECGRVIFCPRCRRKTSLTAGSIMHRSHTPILTWFYAAYLVTTLTPGMSAVQFQKQLGIRCYETAFQMLHKLRSATVDPDREVLNGIVEVDETYVGGAPPGAKGGRSTELKTLVLGAVEVRKDGAGKHYAGRLRLRAVPDASAETLVAFVAEHISKRTVVHTDGWDGYNGLKKLGFRHRPVVQGTPTSAARVLPVIHREFSNMKTWLQGTHHGRVERQHLQAYIDEFVFRHNRRFWRFSAFQRILQLGLVTKPQTYEQLYAAPPFRLR